MRVDIGELEGRQLDFAVCFVTYGPPKDWGDGRYVFEGGQICKPDADPYFLADESKPSQSWAEGGPIIERCGYKIEKVGAGWYASEGIDLDGVDGVGCMDGATPLVAAMRWYVYTLTEGETFDIPDDI